MDVTYNFTAGTRAVAEQVNTNFADVKSAVDPLEVAVADIETQLTSGIILPDGSVDFTRLQSYSTSIVSNATNATPIVVTAVGHGFLTGDKVFISGVGGNTAANGTFTITKIGVDTFSLNSSVGNGTFTSNGTAIIYPSADDNLVNKVYIDTTINNNKGIIKLGTCLTDSATAEKVVNISDTPLVTGLTIKIVMTNANTAAVPTLNFNGIVDSIYNEGGVAVSATNPAYFPNGSTVEFTYNGTYWVFKNKVVKNYVNRTSWYRIYSDGYIEQGGYAAVSTTGYNTISLLLQMKNTSYSPHTQIVTTYGSGISAVYMSVSNITVNSFEVYDNASIVTAGRYWQVNGY